MRAISSHQPWADLIALGQKTIETRSWGTPYRGPLLICAARRYDKLARLITSKYQDPGPHPDSFWPRPIFGPDYKPRLGVALATANLIDCRPMIVQDKRKAGFFRSWNTENLYSWILEDIEPIEPVAIKGRQKLYDPFKCGLEPDDINPLQMSLF